MTWPFDWNDLGYLLVTFIIAGSILALILRAVYGPLFPDAILLDMAVLGRRISRFLVTIFAVAFGLLAGVVFLFTSDIGCGVSSMTASIDDNQIDHVQNVVPINCEVYWTWERP